jgi:CheY-like chemotaxis protein
MTTILVVDDSAMDLQLVRGLLKKHSGWTVLLAANGKEALEHMERQQPDLVLTDLQMPEMNGLELVNVIKIAYPLVPVILMTAAGSEEIAVSALKPGAASYVPKRHLAHELDEVVKQVLSAARQDRGKARLMTHRMTITESTFVLENDPTLIPALISHLQQTMRLMELGNEAERLRVGVALEEAMLNAYYHGNLEVSSELREKDHRGFYDLAKQRALETPFRDRCIHVSARFSRPKSVYVIRDEGPGFDPSTLPDPTDPSNLDRPCGRGLLLMKTFMDEVSYNAAGNEVTLVKRRTSLEDSETLACERQ